MCQRIWATDKNAKKEIAQDKYDDVSTISQRNEMQFWEGKVQKDGRDLFCSVGLWFYVVSWSIWPNDHHMSTNLDFSMFPSQTELLSTKKRPKIYVTGLKMTWYLWHGCLLLTLVVLVPHFFWFHVEAAKYSHDLTKDIRRFDRTIRVGKKNNHTPGILYTTF